MSNAVKKITMFFPRVRYLPVQIKFINENGPIMNLFKEDDKLTLNELGAKLFKKTVFEMAGFVKNQ